MFLTGRLLLGIFAALAISVALPLPVQASESKSYRAGVERIERAQRILIDLMPAPDTEIPTALFRECRGIIIVHQYKAGFILGGKGGGGLAMLRDEQTGRWSAPVFLNTGEISFGFQIGGQSIDSVFFIMNRQGVEMLLKTKFKIGVDASAAIGPVGRDVEAKVGPKTAILAYSRAKGLYAGATFEGGLIFVNGNINRAFYGEEHAKIRNILIDGAVAMPEEAKPLVRVLENYAAAGATTESPAMATLQASPATPPASSGLLSAEPAAKPAAGAATPDDAHAAAASDARQNRLAELKSLHDKGLITDAEYEKNRAKALDAPPDDE